jgi:putative spermidine/putrescine transport system substrate-binding protein
VRNERRWRLWLGAAIVLALAAFTAAGCGGSDNDKGPKAPDKLGKTEGRLSIVNWAGYAESGATDPKVDWVTPFEKKTGCKVSSKIGNTSDEMVTLMRTGKYDGVSASGDATLRLIAGGDVAPVNTKLVPNYKDVFPALKNKPHNTVDGKHYGIPHGRGANLLMWRKDVVKKAPNSWGAVFDENSPYKGKVTAYDNPIYIADAALYLKAHRPDLKIDNVYELDDKQFKAAIDLLKRQRKNVGEYWADYTKEQAAFSGGNSVIGTTWQVTANLLQTDKVPVKTALPKEGGTGWSDTWMIASKAKHPNCMYKWMDWIVSPEANAQVAEYFGEAPANRKSCGLTEAKDHCAVFHASDERFFDRVAYWTTPKKDCGDDRGNKCKDYSEWVQAWTEVKG